MRHLRRLGHCLAAGAVAGAALCPLQLLLWPEITPTAGALVLALLAWSSWAAAWFGTVGFLVLEAAAVVSRRFDSARGGALWRGLVGVELLVVATVAFVNRDQTREQLISARRAALSAAGTVIAVAAVTAVVLALTTRRSRVAHWQGTLAAAVAIAGAWVVLLRAPALPNPQSLPQGPRYKAAHRLLVVSWEGADLPWLIPAIERGDMPVLRSLRESGAWGQMHTTRPYSRTTALTTMATGCLPAIHGLLERRAYRLPWFSPKVVNLLLAGPWPTPHQLPWRLWQRAAAPAPHRATLWEILQQSGMRVGLAGWPLAASASWTVPFPLVSEAAPFDSLDGALRESLEPALAAFPVLSADTKAAFAVNGQIMASTLIHAANAPPDALIVNLDLPARLRPLWTFGEDQPLAANVLTQSARLLDEELGQLITAIAGDDTLIVVASPYGMAAPSPWRRIEHLLGRIDKWRVSPKDAPDGFVLFSGPGVRADARLRGCRLADLTATVLYLLELPVARDMAGRVLVDAVSEERAAASPLRLVPSYPPPSRARR